MTRWIDENAFFILELAPDCSAMDVERQGQKWLGMLELGLESARTYRTPNGDRPRDDQRVRHAMAELQDPRKRIVHELWAGTASLMTDQVESSLEERDGEAVPTEKTAPAEANEGSDARWLTAFEDMGWRLLVRSRRDR